MRPPRTTWAMSPTVLILAAALACAAISAAPQEEEADLLVAPDGVAYASREVAELMEMQPLSDNLLPNGSFEEGRYWPFGWDPTDRLGTFWVEGGTQGLRCIRLDTDLLNSQWVEWNEKVLALVRQAADLTAGRPQSLPTDPVPEPPPRLPTRPPYYDTVGGMHGIHYRSQYLPVEPGAIYRFSVDARSSRPAEPKVFIKGFVDQRQATKDGEIVLKRNAYRAPMTLHGCGPEWKRYARLLHPSRSKTTYRGKPLLPQWLRVELYAYWPVGTYEFDNARLEIVGYEKEAPASTPASKDQEAPPERQEGGFPVFGE